MTVRGNPYITEAPNGEKIPEYCCGYPNVIDEECQNCGHQFNKDSDK